MRDVDIRRATIDDVGELLELRGELHREIGEPSGSGSAGVTTAQQQWFTEHLSTDAFVAWVGEHEGALVACSGMTFLPTPPYPGNLVGVEAYIMNMYTRPGWRRRGIGQRMLTCLLDHARERGVGKVWLRAEPKAEHLYEAAGFATKDGYMETLLRSANDGQWQR